MKASLKFRDDQKPLFRAKIPLSILGFPFQSGVSAGDSKELCLNLSTLFESGPSFKIAYRPNDSWNPFSLVLKTGIGSFGSPISAPLAISAEFNVHGRGNPSFFLRFNPQIGDFSIKKSAGSPIAQPTEKPLVFDPKNKSHSNDLNSDAERPLDDGETSLGNGSVYRSENGIFSGEKVNGFPTETNGVCSINSLFEGVEVSARTVLPVRNHAVLKFRWGVRLPEELKSAFTENQIRNRTAEIFLRKIPFLVMNKISIEHKTKVSPTEDPKRSTVSNISRDADVAEMCFTVKGQLETLQAENVLLRKAVEELRSEVCSRTHDSGKYSEIDMSSSKSLEGKNGYERRNSEKKSSEFAGKVTEGSK